MSGQLLPPLLLVGGLGLLALALLLFWGSGQLQSRTGLSSKAKVVASDTGQNRVRLIEDRKTGLRGKPDYILRERVGLLPRLKMVPVEVKPTRRGRKLYESDEMQLVVYMILLRNSYGRGFAGYGRVRYRDESFVVRLTPEREARCLAYVAQIRAARLAANVRRNHDVRGRCHSCAFRAVCGDSIL